MRPFGITQHELVKLLLQVATLVVVLVTSTTLIYRMNVIAEESARIAKIQAEGAEAWARWTEQQVSFARGEQAGLKERVEVIEGKAPPRIVVVMPTPKVVPTALPTPVPTTRKPGGLIPFFSGSGAD